MAKMINVKLGSNATATTTVIVESTKTIKEVLEENDINYAVAQTYLDGAPLSAGELGKTFDEVLQEDDTSCYLTTVVKTDNA
jgi:hypothetical protein